MPLFRGQRRAREDVIERDKGHCLRCGKPGNEVHHIIPRSHPFRGLWSRKNMCVICGECHGKAHNRQARIELFRKLKQRWGYDYSHQPFAQYMEDA